MNVMPQSAHLGKDWPCLFRKQNGMTGFRKAAE